MRNLGRILLLASGCALISVFSDGAYATTISSPADPALSGATYWGFEELPVTDYISGPGYETAPIVDPSGQVTFTPVTPPRYAVVNYFGQYDQTTYRQIRTFTDFTGYPNNIAAETYEFSFASPVTAFGLSLGQINESGWAAEAFDSTNTSIGVVSWPGTCCNQYFRGIAAPDIALLRLTFTGANDDVTIDNFYFKSASAVPLPAALPLFASGAGVMGLLGWRRKRKKAAEATA